MKKLIILIVSFIIGINILNADCSLYEEYASYVDYSTFSYYNSEEINTKIEIYNLSNNLYIEVRNSYNNDKDTYKFEDTNEGYLTFNTKTVVESINYEVKVYTTDSSCANKVLKTMTFTTPKYNPHITSSVCKGYYDKIEYCDPFYDIKDMDLDEFNKLVEEEIVKIKESEMTISDYIKKYYLYALIPFSVVTGIYVTRIILVKRRKKKYV